MSQEVARPYIGGQAVIEGVMMRSPRSLSIVCRRRSGELVVRERAAPTLAQGPRTWPLVRGIVSRAASSGYRFSSFVDGVTTSVPFTMTIVVRD